MRTAALTGLLGSSQTLCCGTETRGGAGVVVVESDEKQGEDDRTAENTQLWLPASLISDCALRVRVGGRG